MHAVPIIRYVFVVTPVLLGLLFLLSNPDKSASIAAADRWSAVDSLRALAHQGEAVQGHDGTVRFVRSEPVSSEPANHSQLPAPAVQEKPSIMNAQARMDAVGMNAQRAIKQSAAVKPRKQKVAARGLRLRTATAENPQPVSPLMFRPPSW
jgi:hypothetical protein